MNPPIVDTIDPVIVLGGGVSDAQDLKTALTLAPTCVAADSGAHLALSLNVELAAVIGDMDSISDQARAQIPAERFHHIAEQDSTDFDKVLRHVRAPLIVALGFSGGQMDHSLAALNTLVRYSHRQIVLLAEKDVIFLCPKLWSMDLPADTRLSLFPMGPVTGRSEGLRWPIDGIDFAPGGRSGTSNRVSGKVRLEMAAPRMLCILPRAFLVQVIQCLLRLPDPARWPAPAE